MDKDDMELIAAEDVSVDDSESNNAPLKQSTDDEDETKPSARSLKPASSGDDNNDDSHRLTDEQLLTEPYSTLFRTNRKRIRPLNLYKWFVPRAREKSKAAYLRRVERHGDRLISNFEKRQRLAAAATSEENQQDISSQSSSSSDELPDDDDLKDTVDWHKVASTFGTDYALLDAVPIPELSSLIGWATHLTTDNERPLTGESDTNTTEENCNDLNECNPLRGLVNTPLPPSHLEFITNIACKEASTCDEVLQLLESFDQSALVAVGMVLEEMITTSLLPLAQAHVQACREMENKHKAIIPDASESTDKGFANRDAEDQKRAAVAKATEDLFHRRTLPPDEAIFKLLQERQLDSTMGLATLYPPTRTLCEDRVAQPGHVIASLWCDQNHLDKEFVVNNMDILSAFLPIAPNANLSDNNTTQTDG